MPICHFEHFLFIPVIFLKFAVEYSIDLFLSEGALSKSKLKFCCQTAAALRKRKVLKIIVTAIFDLKNEKILLNFKEND